MGEESKKEEGLSPAAAAMRESQPYVSMVWRMVGGCLVGVLLGLGVDRWLDTRPWGLIILSVVGICAGFYGLIKTLNDFEKRRKGR